MSHLGRAYSRRFLCAVMVGWVHVDAQLIIETILEMVKLRELGCKDLFQEILALSLYSTNDMENEGVECVKFWVNLVSSCLSCLRHPSSRKGGSEVNGERLEGETKQRIPKTFIQLAPYWLWNAHHCFWWWGLAKANREILTRAQRSPTLVYPQRRQLKTFA